MQLGPCSLLSSSCASRFFYCRSCIAVSAPCRLYSQPCAISFFSGSLVFFAGPSRRSLFWAFSLFRLGGSGRRWVVPVCSGSSPVRCFSPVFPGRLLTGLPGCVFAFGRVFSIDPGKAGCARSTGIYGVFSFADSSLDKFISAWNISRFIVCYPT